MPKLIKIFAIFLPGLLSACATTNAVKEPVKAPDAWLAQFEESDTQCTDFRNTYTNKGERQDSSQKEGSAGADLSELMFARLLQGQMPKSVELVTDTNGGQLSVNLMGESERKLQYEIGCHAGWHTLRKSRTGQYLGDGVVEKKYEQISFFRIGSRGELVVRILLDAEVNSMYVFDSEVHAEEWYRFRSPTDASVQQ